MKTKYPRIFLATAALSMPAFPSAAQNLIYVPDPAVIDISIQVQEIAVLTVVDQPASTVMDDPYPTYIGDPTWGGSTIGMAKLQLATNFCVGVQFDFVTVSGIRPNPTRFYGRALGQSSGHTLGVQPFARWDGGVVGFGLPVNGSTTDAPFGISKGSGNMCDGYYDIYLGAVTRWDMTLPPEPLFAEPDTYVLPVTATIVP